VGGAVVRFQIRTKGLIHTALLVNSLLL